MQEIAVATSFDHAAIAGQSVYRSVMQAMARPGTVHAVSLHVPAPDGLVPAAAALALTLFDHDTPVFLDASLRATGTVADWLRFHAGCPLVRDGKQASFALLESVRALGALDDFASGTPDYPDRSTTIIVQVDTLTEGPALRLDGPGISGAAEMRVAPQPADFVAQHAANHALFPCGVDLVFAAGQELVALPRTTRITIKRG